MHPEDLTVSRRKRSSRSLAGKNRTAEPSRCVDRRWNCEARSGV